VCVSELKRTVPKVSTESVRAVMACIFANLPIAHVDSSSGTPARFAGWDGFFFIRLLI